MTDPQSDQGSAARRQVWDVVPPGRPSTPGPLDPAPAGGERHERALAQLARLRLGPRGSLRSALTRTAEIVAHALGGELVGIWLLDPDRALCRCADAYSRRLDRHGHGLCFRVADHRDWLRELEDTRALEGALPGRHPALRALGSSLCAGELGSTLDAPILLGGGLRGLIGCGHRAARCTWSRDDRRFLASAADLLALRVAEADAKRRDTDVRGLERCLRAREQTETLGRVAVGVAHDFNNVLTAVKGYLQLLTETVEEADSARRFTGRALTALDRAAGLAQQLLSLARIERCQPELLDVNRVVTGLGDLLQALCGAGCVVEVDLAPGLGRVRAGRGRLEQVLLNLVFNAKDAMPQGGRVGIATSGRPAGAGNGAADHVVLAVTDSGIGMDPALCRRIFKRCFTTKGNGCGFGFGLSTVAEVVHEAGGTIRVDSEPGRGSVFEVSLPVAAGPGPG